MKQNELLNYARKYGIRLSDNQATQLLQDMSLVLDYNKKINLTAIKNEEDFVDKHLIDSLLCNIHEDNQNLKILDIGTGGGFPGIPLAIKYPNDRFTLLDSTEKKIKTVEKIASEIGLKNVSCITGRAEELAREKTFRESFDVVVSRGVADYAILLELCTSFLKKGGLFFSWKGPKYKDEINNARSAMELLNMKIIEIKSELLLKSEEVHVIIIAEKKDHTPEKYPRSFGKIKKRPL